MFGVSRGFNHPMRLIAIILTGGWAKSMKLSLLGVHPISRMPVSGQWQRVWIVMSNALIASDLRPEQLIARVYTRCSTKRFAHVCSYYRRGEHFNVASIAEQEQA